MCVSVCVSEKESDSEVCVRGAEAVSGLVGVRYFVDNKYLQAQRPTEVTKPWRRDEVSHLRRQSCILKKHRMGKNMWKPYRKKKICEFWPLWWCKSKSSVQTYQKNDWIVRTFMFLRG